MAEPELRLLDERAAAGLYRREFPGTFPPSERKPLETILRQMGTGRYLVWGLFRGEELNAYALLWQTEDRKAALLDYLGVPRALRGRGHGSGMLARLREAYGETAILAEVEAPSAEEPGERALQESRLGFYRRSGFRELDFDSWLFGVHYRMLAAGPGEDGALLRAYRGLYRGHLPGPVYEKYVQIPWLGRD